MITGIDASHDCSSIARTLARQGRRFVCRYYANSGKKRLNKNEAQTLSGAGLKIVVVWEDGFPTSSSYFSFTKGVDDGTSAYHDALQIGQPAGSPIYFAVDYDASNADLAGVINDYFNGITQGLKLASRNNMEHPVGVYGSGATCGFILKRGLATYSWLAMSSGWQGHEFSNWHIRQSAGITYSGIAVDFDESNNDGYGGFTL
jgi:hypothetical protein